MSLVEVVQLSLEPLDLNDPRVQVRVHLVQADERTVLGENQMGVEQIAPDDHEKSEDQARRPEEEVPQHLSAQQELGRNEIDFSQSHVSLRIANPRASPNGPPRDLSGRMLSSDKSMVDIGSITRVGMLRRLSRQLSRCRITVASPYR